MSVFKYNPETAEIGFGTKSFRILEILFPYLQQANKCKYNFIDCAWRYGNEAIIGLALKEIKLNDSNFILNVTFQSKVWPSQFSGGIAKSLKFTLQKIGAISSVSGYMLHRPAICLKANLAAWKQLIDCKKKRLTAKIGLCHFDKGVIDFLFEKTNYRPDFVQYELSLNNMRYDRIVYCHQHQIKIQAVCPLGQYEKNLENPLILEMVKKYNTNVKNLSLAFLLNQNIAPIVVPSSEDEISSLMEAKNIILSLEDIEKLKSINTYENTQTEGAELDLDSI